MKRAKSAAVAKLRLFTNKLLVPYSCKNAAQAKALKKQYDPLISIYSLPRYDTWPELPSELATSQRRTEIESEFFDSQADIIITLGDQPLKWFTSHYGTERRLSAYGTSSEKYGKLHEFSIAGKQFQLLPLVHPRQAAKLGGHSSVWCELHEKWMKHPQV